MFFVRPKAVRFSASSHCPKLHIRVDDSFAPSATEQDVIEIIDVMLSLPIPCQENDVCLGRHDLIVSLRKFFWQAVSVCAYLHSEMRPDSSVFRSAIAQNACGSQFDAVVREHNLVTFCRL